MFLFFMFSSLFLLVTGSQQPHIVFVLMDDWGFNDVGYHNPEVLTPNLDLLSSGEGGVRLEQSYVSAWCTPSRAALLTGKYPYHIGRQNDVFITTSLGGLTLEEKLLPEYLKELGYQTHMVGKWHLGHCNEAYLPTSRGFDSFFGFMNSQIYSESLLAPDAPYPVDFFNGTEVDKKVIGQYHGDLARERALAVIRSHSSSSSSPLFLYLALPHSHWPLWAPLEFTDLYPGVSDDDKRRTYLAMVSHADQLVGEVVRELKDRGLYNNSILVVMGDNGAFQDRRSVSPYLGGGSNYPLRGQKGEYYEGGTRTPAFVHSPLLETSGYSSNKMIHVTDWFPTILSLAGATEDAHEEVLDSIDGVDQSNVLLRDGPAVRSDFVYNIWNETSEETTYTLGAIRFGRWKALNFQGEDLPLGRFELYDLESDPGETEELSERFPQVAAFMEQRFWSLASSMVTADDKGFLTPDELGLCVDRGRLRTDYCGIDGSIVGKEGAGAGAVFGATHIVSAAAILIQFFNSRY